MALAQRLDDFTGQQQADNFQLLQFAALGVASLKTELEQAGRIVMDKQHCLFKAQLVDRKVECEPSDFLHAMGFIDHAPPLVELVVETILVGKLGHKGVGIACNITAKSRLPDSRHRRQCFV